MNDQFAEALFHKRHTVCGITLAPFTFAHAAVLDFAGNPYASLTGRASLDDIAFALAVCREPGQFPVQIPKPGRFLRRRIARAVFRAGLPDAHAALLSYFEDYNCPPVMWQKEGGRGIKTPWMLHFVAILIRSGRMSQQEAWATEVGYGRWLCAALAEAAGNDVPIVTDAERAALKEAGYGECY